MGEVIQLVLIASLAVSGAAGAIIAAWRMIPRLTSTEVPTARLQEVEDAIEQLRLSLIDLSDKYEVTIRRNNVRVGRLRRKLARATDDDLPEEDDDDQEAPVDVVQPILAAPPGPASKPELWNRVKAMKQGVTG